MYDMKSDMSGAAVLLGIMQVLPRLQLPVAVYGHIPLAENLVGQYAYKPGDIITFRNKKNVEIVNTDAEGRLLLADALILAAEQKPRYIIELSTLTGSVTQALGRHLAAVMGHHKKLVAMLLNAGKNTGEQLCEFPLLESYLESIKSRIADLKNAGYGVGAGVIKAGLFLDQFVKNIPFAHIDIAGTAFLPKSEGFYARDGATGFGVRLLLEFLQMLVKSTSK